MVKASDKDKKSAKKASDITSMAVSISVSERIESYCKKRGMLKKDFLPRAIEFVETFDIDLAAETLYFEEKQAEKEAREAERADVQALPALREQFANVLQLQHDNGTLSERVIGQQKDLTRLTDENKELKEKLNKLQDIEKQLATAKTELQHCKGLFSSANEKVLRDLGIY